MFKFFSKYVLTVLLLIALSCSFVSCGLGFGSVEPSEDAFKEAYSQKVDKLLDDIDEYYKLTEDYNAENVSLDANISFNLSSELIKLIRSYTNEDFAWINDAELNLRENIKGDITKTDVALSYKGKNIISASVIMDFINSYVYLGSEELGGNFLKEKLNNSENVSYLTSINPLDSLPDKNALKALIETCFDIVIENIEGVEFEEAELTVNGITEECVQYEVEFTEKEAADTAVDLLVTLKNDNNFKTVIYNLVEYLNSVSEENFDADDAYEEILEEIDDLIKAFSDTDMFANDVLASWTSYITEDLEFIGTKIDLFGIVPNGAATLYIAKATDGDDVGSTISARVGSETYFEMGGTLVDNGKTLSGTYEISVQGESLAFIDLENVNVKKLEDKYFVGSISISPSRNLVDLIVEESGVSSFAGLNIASLSVKLDVEENDGEKIKATMSILNGTSSYASVSFDTEIGDGEKITIPSNTSSDAEKWFASLDFNSLIENAESSGIPDYVIELIEMLTLGIG